MLLYCLLVGRTWSNPIRHVSFAAGVRVLVQLVFRLPLYMFLTRIICAAMIEELNANQQPESVKKNASGEWWLLICVLSWRQVVDCNGRSVSVFDGDGLLLSELSGKHLPRKVETESATELQFLDVSCFLSWMRSSCSTSPLMETKKTKSGQSIRRCAKEASPCSSRRKPQRVEPWPCGHPPSVSKRQKWPQCGNGRQGTRCNNLHENISQWFAKPCKTLMCTNSCQHLFDIIMLFAWLGLKVHVVQVEMCLVPALSACSRHSKSFQAISYSSW